MSYLDFCLYADVWLLQEVHLALQRLPPEPKRSCKDFRVCERGLPAHACAEADINSRNHDSNKLKTHIADRKRFLIAF